jgi:pantoate--beta-alanine ligase
MNKTGREIMKFFELCGFCGVHIYRNAQGLQDAITHWRNEGRAIAFVPTMGALHAGHLGLLQRASALPNTRVVCSIFVNPTQFNDPADLRAYPRNPARDLALLVQQGRADALYQPEADDIYPAGMPIPIYRFGELEQVMEGAMRPGHFAGVGQVVSRLLQIVDPDYLLLGEKDYQQFLVVRDLLRQLSDEKQHPTHVDSSNRHKMNVETARAATHRIPSLIMGTTHRDEGGLALSSRNQRLSPTGRVRARRIFATLSQARELWQQDPPHRLLAQLRALLEKEPEFHVEYIQFADADTLETVSEWKNHPSVRAFAAVWIEGVRLIDNTPVFP